MDRKHAGRGEGAGHGEKTGVGPRTGNISDSNSNVRVFHSKVLV